jgi:hypothetical protein
VWGSFHKQFNQVVLFELPRPTLIQVLLKAGEHSADFFRLAEVRDGVGYREAAIDEDYRFSERT